MKYSFMMAILGLSIASADAASPEEGQSLYAQHCAVCHGSKGDGITPDMPDFGAGDGLWVSDAQLLRRVEEGERGCPPFEGLLSRQEILNVIAYLRTLF